MIDSGVLLELMRAACMHEPGAAEILHDWLIDANAPKRVSQSIERYIRWNLTWAGCWAKSQPSTPSIVMHYWAREALAAWLRSHNTDYAMIEAICEAAAGEGVV